MKVLKFGGTSVGSSERMKKVLEIVTQDRQPKLIVLSAMSGTTNKLKDLATLIKLNEKEIVQQHFQKLKTEYLTVARQLFKGTDKIHQGLDLIQIYFSRLACYTEFPFSEKNERRILALGELISTELFHLLCQAQGIKSELIPALDIVRLKKNNYPDIPFTRSKLHKILSGNTTAQLYITQGYICLNHEKEVDNLGRGGSDYTATIIGAAIDSEEVQIWTDIDGIHNNDPRWVDKTTPVGFLSYDTASMLAYFGAKILHPTCVIPAKKAGIPIRIKNTFQPDAVGTLIKGKGDAPASCVVSVKDDELLLTIHPSQELSNEEVISRIFAIFKKHHINIDMLGITQFSISVVFEAKAKSEAAIAELKKYGKIQVEPGYSIVNIMDATKAQDQVTLPQIFNSINQVPIKMINQKNGSCDYILLLISALYKEETLNALNQKILNQAVIEDSVTWE